MIEKLKNSIGPATIHSLYSIVYLLFIVPFDLWVKAVVRLSEQKENGTLAISKIDSPWPFLSFVKNLCLEFLFDFFTFISYILGPIIAIVAAIQDNSFAAFIGALVGAYYLAVVFSLYRDFFQMAILPFRKMISWFRKPAQHLDLNIKG